MTNALPLLTIREAILFVSAPADTDAAMQQLLADTLQRVSVQAARQRVVTLQDQPLLGRQYQVRVTPCLLLDTGTRRVQLLGDPAQLNDGSLRQALTCQ